MAFHIGLSVLMSCIARSEYFLQLHNGQGIWNFAMDSTGYHAEALSLFELLKNGDYSVWWGSSSSWHVKWIALSYDIFTPSPISFTPINALIWIISITCVYQIALQLFPDKHNLAVVSAMTFGFWPSYLLHTTQLLKDPFYVMGMLMMIWGWVSLLSSHRGIGFSLLIGFGVLLAYLIRPYILEPLICLSLLGLIFVLWRSRRAWCYALLAFVLISGLYAYERYGEIQPRRLAETKHLTGKSNWHYSDWIPDRVEYRLIQIAYSRDRWPESYPEAGSNIDADVRFRSLFDIVKYLPRAFQIGFLSPFPAHWFQEGRTAGRPSRIIAGFEMMGWYLLLAGFVYFFAAGPTVFQIRIWLVVYSISLVLLTALVVMNLGALFRMRFVYFLPILIGGLEGWSRYIWSRRHSGTVRRFFQYQNDNRKL